MKFKSEVELEALNNATIDTDKFLVSDSSTVKYRTGAQVLSDIGGQAALTNPITGTGTVNYVSKFTGSTTLGNSQIFDNGSGIGIGTTSPNYSSAGRGVLDINGSSQSMLALSVGGVGKSFLFYTGTDLLVSNESNGAIKLNTNGSEKAIITATGNVGIGTTSPSAKLNVSGDIHIGDYGSAASRVLDFRTSNSVFTITTDGTSAALGTTLTYSWASGGGGPLKFNNAGGEVMRLSSTGNVGIGTSLPDTKLHIEDVTKVLTNNVAGVAQGTLSLASTDAQAANIGTSLLFGGNFITGNQTRIAYAAITGRKANGSSGNADGYLSFLTWRSTGLTEAMRITAYGNVGIGTTNPARLLDVNGDAIINTLTVGKGSNNIATNSAFGYLTLNNNDTGANNVAIGYEALRDNDTGNSNVAVGVYSLRLNNGDYNTCIGTTAGSVSTGATGMTLMGFDLNYKPDTTSTPLGNSELAISQYWSEYPGKPHFYAPDRVAIGASTNTEILSVSWDAYNAFFVDYSFDDASGNLRAGTIKCIFTASGGFTYQLTDDKTADIGNTTDFTFDVIDDGSHNAVLRVINAGGTSSYIRFTSRLLFKTI